MSSPNGIDGSKKPVTNGLAGGTLAWCRGRCRCCGLAAAGVASAAAFDTRAGVRMAGGAAPGIARRLRRHGYRILGSEGYVVEDTHGPLREGEIARARDWGAGMSRQLAA